MSTFTFNAYLHVFAFMYTKPSAVAVGKNKSNIKAYHI